LKILSILVATTLLSASIIHFYWAWGGAFGLSSAIPKIVGSKDFKPPTWATFLVAMLLLSLAFLSILLSWSDQIVIPYISLVGYLVSAVFIIRSIGDFKYVGFLKKVYNSRFAKLDTLYFSPLILLLGISFGILSKFG